jgi:hypothetical protein
VPWKQTGTSFIISLAHVRAMRTAPLLQVALAMECKWRGLTVPPVLCSWVDLKRAYTRHFKRAANLRSCVEAAGLKWEGRAHSGLDDARNEARLAGLLMTRGVKFTVTGEFAADAPHRRQPEESGAAAAKAAGEASTAGGSSSGPAVRKAPRQTLLAPLAPPKPVATSKGRCKCGIDAARRVTKKPGPNHGRAFFSCGNWRMVARGGRQPCDFFQWAEAGE